MNSFIAVGACRSCNSSRLVEPHSETAADGLGLGLVTEWLKSTTQALVEQL